MSIDPIGGKSLRNAGQQRARGFDLGERVACGWLCSLGLRSRWSDCGRTEQRAGPNRCPPADWSIIFFSI